MKITNEEGEVANDYCRTCGRESIECSINPCAAVLEDREEEGTPLSAFAKHLRSVLEYAPKAGSKWNGAPLYWYTADADCVCWYCSDRALGRGFTTILKGMKPVWPGDTIPHTNPVCCGCAKVIA